MKQTEKAEFISDLKSRLETADAFYLTDFTGINVKNITELRRRLRETGTEFVVVKNTLALRAIEGFGLQDLSAYFTGPTGVAIARNDPIPAAKVLTDFAKENDGRPGIKFAIIDRVGTGPDMIKKLAALPSKNVLLAQLAGTMLQVASGFARAVDGLRRQREEQQAA